METKISFGVIMAVALLTALWFTAPTLLLKQTDAARQGQTLAPMVASEDNLYIVWWTNKTGNWEVMFRASNDAGETIRDKINLSNSPVADSQNAEIVAQDDKVYVIWWETSNNPANKTSESVLRISNDNGNTFGPVLVLGNNGTLIGGGGGQGATGAAAQ